MSILSSRCSVLTAALIGSALALGSTLISKPAFAGTATANMSVSATVPATCTITTTDMNFGSYNSTQASSTLAQATITATCSSGTNATVSLNSGANSGGGLQRKLKTSGNQVLDYNIFTDGDYGTVWGDGTGATVSIGLDSNGTPETLTAYGAIPPNQSVPVGNYADVVTATITY